MAAEPTDHDPRVPLNLRVRKSNKARLRRVADIEGRNLSNLCQWMLATKLEELEQKHGIEPAATEATPSRTRRARSST